MDIDIVAVVVAGGGEVWVVVAGVGVGVGVASSTGRVANADCCAAVMDVVRLRLNHGSWYGRCSRQWTLIGSGECRRWW